MKGNIYKYPVAVFGERIIQVVGLKKILCVKKQRDQPVLYALIDPNDPTVKTFSVIPVMTGEELDLTGCSYVGTCMFSNGDFVAHYFIKEI